MVFSRQNKTIVSQNTPPMMIQLRRFSTSLIVWYSIVRQINISWFLSLSSYREPDSYLISDKDGGARIKIHILLYSRFFGKLGPGTDVFDIIDQRHEILELDQFFFILASGFTVSRLLQSLTYCFWFLSYI